MSLSCSSCLPSATVTSLTRLISHPAPHRRVPLLPVETREGRILFRGMKSSRRKSLEEAMPHGTFEAIVLPHLDAAFNYARWLTRNDADAEDVVQDACVRAIRFFPALRHSEARAWLFAIVRNTWYTRIGRRPRTGGEAIDDDALPDLSLGPEALLMQRMTVDRVRDAIEQLPPEFREVVVLREIEGLSYKEIASVIDAPIGTVMSRLSRARSRLYLQLAPLGTLEGFAR
jgi:RNA polymerase sigma-70 factor (ECF subfamily)